MRNKIWEYSKKLKKAIFSDQLKERFHLKMKSPSKLYALKLLFGSQVVNLLKKQLKNQWS